MRTRLSCCLLLLLLPLVLVGPAVANSCQNFATYTCATGTPDIARLGGGSAAGLSVGFVLSGTNQFSVFTTNGNAASDVIIVGASASPLTGTLNGQSFTSLSMFPEQGATGAVSSTLAALGFCSSPCDSLSFGYVDLHSALTAHGSLNVIANGVSAGTALYAMLIVDGKVKYITPNSEALVIGGSIASIPEPATMTLLATGLIGLAGIVRRKARA